MDEWEGVRSSWGNCDKPHSLRPVAIRILMAAIGGLMLDRRNGGDVAGAPNAP